MSGRVFSGLGFLQNVGRHIGFECYPRSGIGQNLARIRVGKEKRIRNSTWEKFGMRDFREKKSGNAGSGSPFSDTSLGQHFRGWSWRRRPTQLLEAQLNFSACMLCFPNSDHVMLSREFAFCLFIRYAFILCGTITWSGKTKHTS